MTHHYLGIDYGRKHIGVALAVTPLAEPLETLPRKIAVERIAHFIAEYKITDFVVGASEGSMLEETEVFAQELIARFGLPVHFQDETLSSHDTRLAMARAGVSKKKREQKIDHFVAAGILQDYMETL